LADVLNQNPGRNVLIEGFTDSTGSHAHNQELSERRATAVRAALTEMGVGKERVSMKGYGEGYPVASNDTASNRLLNRRVEIVLSNEGGAIAPRM
jgi:outer membrane protein OmpA-like peptidoglycan-associated protein